MKLYLGVTDTQWFSFLRQALPTEVNFWQPGGGQRFKVLPQGGPFLFKLKAPINKIGGLGFFVSHTKLPLQTAWEFFGSANGTDDFRVFREKILSYRRDGEPNPQIGCNILTDPVFFQEEDWIPVPENWSPNIVQGKSYDTAESIGRRLWQQVEILLEKYRWLDRDVAQKDQLLQDPQHAEYREVLSKVRVGQGTFRTLITDAYHRKCAVSGEKTLPVLEAAHIKPYAQSGPHAVNNGVLLRSDLHKLFDSGYLTFTDDYRVEVSRRIREEFENGRDYYKYEGEKLLILPQQIGQRPDHRFLTWHQEHVYNG